MPNRPQPRFPEPNTEYFWEGCKEGELRYQVNDATGEVVFYPRMHDPKTGSRDLSWKVSKGEVTIYKFSVVRQNRMPNFIDLGAYSVAYIDLDEGFRIMSTIVGVDNPTEDISIGQRVRVEFEKQDELVTNVKENENNFDIDFNYKSPINDKSIRWLKFGITHPCGIVRKLNKVIEREK